MHYYEFNLKDWLASTSHLTPEEEGIYLRLTNHYYKHEKRLPNDIPALARKLRLVGKEDLVEALLNEFFQKTSTGWKKQRAENVIEKYQKRAKTARENGALGGRPPKEKDIEEPNNNPEETQEEPSGFLEKTQEKANHKPITNNQLTKEPSTRFVPPTFDEVANEFSKKGLELSMAEIEARKFLDHYESCGWVIGQGRKKMKSWPHAVSMWISRIKNHQGSTSKNYGDRSWSDE